MPQGDNPLKLRIRHSGSVGATVFDRNRIGPLVTDQSLQLQRLFRCQGRFKPDPPGALQSKERAAA